MAQKKRAIRAKKRASRNPRLSPVDYVGKRELVVMAREEVGLRVTRRSMRSEMDIDVKPLADALKSMKVAMRPLFGSESRIAAKARALAETTDITVPDLSVFYQVDVPERRLEEVAEALRDQETVEAAFVKPPTELPAIAGTRDETLTMNRMLSTRAIRATTTPFFVPEQG